MITFLELGFDSQLCNRICLTLAHSLWQVSVLAACAVLLVSRLRRDKPERGYSVYVGAMLLAIVALPITYWQLGSEMLVVTETLAATNEAGWSAQSLEVLPSREIAKPQADSEPVSSAAAIVSNQAATSVGFAAIAPWLLGVYLLGVAVMLLRVGQGVWKAQRLASLAQPISSGPLVAALERLARSWSLRVLPRLAEAQHIIVPQVVGLLRPTILIPTSALTGLTPSELEMILAHELAHVHRHDMWVNLLQRLAESILFFNPALWYLSRRVSTHREYCCDEQTCRVKQDEAAIVRLRYAQALLHVVELSGKGTQSAEIAALAATGAGPSELRRRVARLFGEPLREPMHVSRSLLVTAALLVLIAIAGPANGWIQGCSGDEKTSQSKNVEVAQLLSALRQQCGAVYENYDVQPFDSNVTKLSLWQATPAAFDTLSRFSELEELEFQVTDLRVEEFDKVAKLKKLKRFKSVNCNMWPEQLNALSGLTKLEDLDVELFRQLSDAEWKKIYESLTAKERRYVDLWIKKKLHLQVVQSTVLTDRSLEALSKLKHLKSLMLINTSISDEGLKRLQGCTELQRLWISMPVTTVETGRILADMKLREFRGMNVDDSVLKKMCESKTLEDLEVWAGDVTDESIDDLLKMQQLRRLQLRGSQITDKGLLRLTGLRRLEYLDLDYAVRITLEGVEEFRNVRPTCEVKLQESGKHNKSAPPAVANVAADSADTVADEKLEKIKVEVVAIGTNDDRPQMWWDANGKRMDNPPVEWNRSDPKWKEGRGQRKLIFQIHNLPADVHVAWNTRSDFTPDMTTQYVGGSESPSVYQREIYLEDGATDFALNVGVARGEWQTVASTQATIDLLVPPPIVKNPNALLTGVFLNGSDSAAVLSHSITGKDLRVVAIDKHGTVHVSGEVSTNSVGTLNQSTWKFRNLKQSQIDRFEFQTRDYEWTEIKNLPVEPGQRTTLAPSKEDEKLAILSLTSQQTEWIAKIRKLTDHNPTAFSVGPQMIAELSPQESWQVVQTVWPEIEIDEVKTGLLKTFEFARHPKVLNVLDLGANDESEFVRDYAYWYLQNYALRDFKKPEYEYQSWRSENAQKLIDEVLVDNCQWFVDQLRDKPPITDVVAWKEFEMMLHLGNSKLSYPIKAEYLLKAGLPAVLRSWRDDVKLDDRMKRELTAFIGMLEKTLDDSLSYINVDLSGRNLEGISLLGNVDSLFMNANLSKTDLSNATLVGGAKAFYETNFSEANLKDAVLIGRAALQKANLSGANLENTLVKSGVSGLQEANFDDAVIRGARIHGSMQLATFRRARIADTRFEGIGPAMQMSNFEDSQLTNTTLVGTSFQAVSLNNTQFQECDLSTVRANDLASSKFETSTPPRYDAATKFPEDFDPADHGWQLIE